ncbi:Outer membrane efflux protein [Marivirga sericea]|uniref:Outer membrane efflux protein n=1 Tax=Marivirga sericea TaxID=1028 RepID=A0A1X7KM02_9BACT|nr:TolC family protein [Marivirga sericea]SMG41743.1 Outer membrane efflux protein [Marivirga sericea]
MRILFAICLLAFRLSLFAQNVDYNRIILPPNSENIEFSEKLVQLAWKNHPDNITQQEQVEISQIDLKISRRRGLTNLRFGANLNEFNIDPSSDLGNRSLFFPKYNFSMSFPLGDLFLNPLENKQNQILIEISENDLKAAKLLVRRNVLQAYNDYLLVEEIYKIQRLAMDNAETNHAIVEESFEQGEETYDKYTASFNNLNQRKITLLQAERDYKNAKLTLEEMIGVPLENIN